MATNTTNYDLSKPAYTDTADIAVINSNMDKVDTSLQGLGTGLAIISKNNAHDAIIEGQYIYIHGHGSLSEGLYAAKSNIAANATLSSSNVSAVPGGLGIKVMKSFGLHIDSPLIKSNENLNDYVTAGTYICPSNAVALSLLNTPYTAGNFTLIVSANSGIDGSAINGNQIILPGTGTANFMYIRGGSRDSGWGNWTRLGYNAQPSGTDTFYNTVVPGYISGGSAAIALMLPTPIRFDNITSISVTKLTGVCRGINGYIDNVTSTVDWVGRAGITVTADKRNNSSIYILIQKSSAFANVTNNTPVSLQASEIAVSYT